MFSVVLKNKFLFIIITTIILVLNTVVGCSSTHRRHINTAPDFRAFGVKDTYTINRAKDLKTLKAILVKVYNYQLYTSDKLKYNKDDVHENIAKYIDLLDKIGVNVSRDTLSDACAISGYSMANFKYSNGRWWVTGDCESTYLAIETFAIEAGINPQRLFEVYCNVLKDDLTTVSGGHMFGFYVDLHGQTYSLEQLPYFRDLKTLYNKRHYRFLEFRRADKPIEDFARFPARLTYDLIHDNPIRLQPTNEINITTKKELQ